MTKQRQANNWDFEVLNPIETKKVIGGWWGYRDIEPIDLGTWGGNDWGSWWDNSGLPGTGGNPDYGGGDYGGGSGSSSGSSSSFPSHICTQAPGSATCATMAMSYVANYFGGNGITSSDFAQFAGQNFNSMLAGQGGLNYSQLHAAVNTFFQNTIIDGTNGNAILNELNAGHPILGTIDQGGGIGHEVVITGFDSSAGTVTYMDSIAGGAVTANISTVSFMGSLFAISGLQNNTIVDKYKNDTDDVSACTICGK